MLHEHGIQVVFTGMNQAIERGLATEGVFSYLAAVFDQLDEGVEWVQSRLLDWVRLSMPCYSTVLSLTPTPTVLSLP